MTGLIPVLLQDSQPGKAALINQIGLKHALAIGATAVCSLSEFIDHHSLEDIGLFAR
jgi:hypothetical protein